MKIFTAEGRPAGQIGRKGGRPLLGPWQADGFYAISSLLVDKQGRLWVTEGDRHPERISIWDMSKGKPVKELFGPTHYGASGGAICPTDPNLMVSEGCEWRFDPKTQTFACSGVFDRSLHGFAKFCTPVNGRLYLAVTREYQPYRSATRIFERIGEGTWRVRAEVRPDFIAKTTTFWSDVNGDGREDAGETITVPEALVTYGSNAWSLNLNPHDFTLYGVTDGTRKVYQVRLAGYTACGAPRWDVAGRKELPFAGGKDVCSALPSPDNRLLLTCGEHTYYRCYEIAGGKLLWSYPNPFFQVHGSHHAPAAEPGLTRGAYGFVGAFTHPNTGTVWAINANLGEWYLLTERGYFLARIFEGDAMQWQWPAKAEVGADMTRCPPGSGGEDFGGSLTQGKDGKVYVQAGKNAVWSLELGNLDQVRSIATGSLTLKPEEQSLARAEFEKQRQRAVGVQTCEVRRFTPAFTGNLGSRFPGRQSAGIQEAGRRGGEDLPGLGCEETLPGFRGRGQLALAERRQGTAPDVRQRRYGRFPVRRQSPGRSQAQRGGGGRLPALDRQLPGPAHGRALPKSLGREETQDLHLRRDPAIRDGLRRRRA